MRSLMSHLAASGPSRTTNSLRWLARIIPVRLLQLLHERDIALLGVGGRGFGIDFLLPGLLLCFALCDVFGQ
jgi:hypothetical protein